MLQNLVSPKTIGPHEIAVITGFPDFYRVQDHGRFTAEHVSKHSLFHLKITVGCPLCTCPSIRVCGVCVCCVGDVCVQCGVCALCVVESGVVCVGVCVGVCGGVCAERVRGMCVSCFGVVVCCAVSLYVVLVLVLVCNVWCVVSVVCVRGVCCVCGVVCVLCVWRGLARGKPSV